MPRPMRMFNSTEAAKKAHDLRIAQLAELHNSGYLDHTLTELLARKYRQQLYEYTRKPRMGRGEQKVHEAAAAEGSSA